ncbi:MAG TPA: hypothetical protein VKD71_13260, partial [Gemmataceae bacterium]|nr:hypothetical protein [Gemmataceae bacterium]
LPESVVKQSLEKLDRDLKKELDKEQVELAKKWTQSISDSMRMILTDGREFVLGVDFDRKTGDLAIVSEMSARSGTPLAKAHKEAKPTVSRFVGLAKEAALYFGLSCELPPFDWENDLGPAVEELQKTIQKDGVRIEKERLEKLLKDLISAIDRDRIDLAVAVFPVGEKRISFVGGIGVKDGRKADAALAEFRKLTPKEDRDAIKITSEKLGSAVIHRLESTKAFDPEITKLFGKPEVVLGFAADRMLFGMGEGVDTRIKAALAAQSEPSPMFVVDLAFAKLLSLMEATAKDDAERAQMKKVLAVLKDDPGRMRLFHLSRTTGESIKYRVGIDILTPLKWVVALQKAGIDLSPGAAPPVPAKPATLPRKP